ncbi:hypothetical protein H6B10_17870, partial [Gemmiger formicilis]|uniref:hypothetical protein n=1 Tax=Gemmiger formicilis TaxID=745368 RepID=UPI00195675D0
MIRASGRVPHSDHLMVTRETAPPHLAQRLELPPDGRAAGHGVYMGQGFGHFLVADICHNLKNRFGKI